MSGWCSFVLPYWTLELRDCRGRSAGRRSLLFSSAGSHRVKTLLPIGALGQFTYEWETMCGRTCPGLPYPGSPWNSTAIEGDGRLVVDASWRAMSSARSPLRDADAAATVAVEAGAETEWPLEGGILHFPR